VARLVEEEPLGQVHAEVPDGLELLAPLDPLGHDLGALSLREADDGLDEVLLEEVGVDVGDQRDVELDEVRRQVGDGAESGVAAACIVDGEAEATLAEGGEVLLEARVVLDRGALRDFENDPAGVVDAELTRIEVAELRVVEVVGVDVEEEELILLEVREDALDGALPEQAAELPDEVGLFGYLEEDLGGTERAARAAGE